MSRIRLSWSLISAWERGDVAGAVNLYFHIDHKHTPALDAGREHHKEIAEHIEKFNTLPDYMNFKPNFLTPKIEHAVVVAYNEICDLKGVFDCLEEPYLYEWKTGNSDSLEWARSGQVGLYFLICELAGIDVKTAYLVRFNQYTNKSDLTVIHNSKTLRDKARNLVDSTCFEIHQYFLQAGLIS